MSDRRLQSTYSLEQAAVAAPALVALRERIRESETCLSHIRHLIPAPLRRQVQAGPIHDTEWCLLVGSVAASTKLRQLLPTMQQTLTQKGSGIRTIRLKVQTSSR